MVQNKNNKVKEKDPLKELSLLSEMLRADEILERTVTSYGNSSHIPIPSKHLGKKARVFIYKNKTKEAKK